MNGSFSSRPFSMRSLYWSFLLMDIICSNSSTTQKPLNSSLARERTFSSFWASLLLSRTFFPAAILYSATCLQMSMRCSNNSTICASMASMRCLNSVKSISATPLS